MSNSGGCKPMDSPQQITDRITTFFAREIASDARNSYHSWEHCYNFFATRPTNFDLASLHLGFYLASWGMYRGSAAIRNFDYLIHRPAAEELLKPDYDLLRGASLDELVSRFDTLLWPLIERIRKQGLYPKCVTMTDTLVTKILMGTLGCTPAYDRFLKAGLEEKGLNSSFSRRNLEAFLRHCQQNQQGFSDAQGQIQQTSNYPVMRVVDIYFHSIGLESPWIADEE